MARYHGNTMMHILVFTGLIVLGSSVGGVAGTIDSRATDTGMTLHSGSHVIIDSTITRNATDTPCGPKGQLSHAGAGERGTAPFTTHETPAVKTHKQRVFRFLGARKRISSWR